MKKTIKIIDLLNKIANGEEVPKKIKWNDDTWCYSGKPGYNYLTDYEDLFSATDGENLNDEVEILDVEDEFEDIELDTSYYHDEPALIDDLAHTVSLLIKNQKKIISRLKDE